MQEYKDINLELKYSGTIVIKRNMKKEFYTRYSIGSHSYETIFELDFEDGKLIKSRETSGTSLRFFYIFRIFFHNFFRKLLR